MRNEPWRETLSRLIADAATVHGGEVVREALEAEIAGLEPVSAVIEPLRPEVAVLALVEYATGWLGVLLHRDGRLTVHEARSRDALTDQVHGAAEEDFLLVDPGPQVVVADREQLRVAGITVPPWFSGSGFSEDDLLAACTAVRAAVAG